MPGCGVCARSTASTRPEPSNGPATTSARRRYTSGVASLRIVVLTIAVGSAARRARLDFGLALQDHLRRLPGRVASGVLDGQHQRQRDLLAMPEGLLRLLGE